MVTTTAAHSPVTVPLAQENIPVAVEFADSARAFLAARSPSTRLRKWREQTPCFDRAMWLEMAQAGWTGILAPEAMGGLGLDIRCAGAIAEATGAHLIPEPFIGGAVQVMDLLVRLPASGLRDSLIRDVASGQKIIGLAWEDAPSMGPMTATRCGEQIVLRGEKVWVTPGSGAHGWLVCATSTSGPSIYWMPAEIGHLEVHSQRRVDGTEMARLVCHDVQLGESHLLACGALVPAAIDAANDVARLAQGFELLGLSVAAQAMTLEYLKTRVQFGKPIGANQALQHRMVDAALQIELASSCLRDALDGLSAQTISLSLAASRVKARCAHAAMTMTQLAIQLHGAIGFTDEHDIGLYFKRSLNLASWLGGVHEHRMRAIAEMQSGFSATQPAHPVCEKPRTGDDPEETRLGPDELANLSEGAFRQTIRDFLVQHYPGNLRHPPRRLRWLEIRDWYLALSKRGWLAPAWPRQHGGMGLPADKLLMYFEEMESFGAARMPDQGLINLGPILIRRGTPQQQADYLPKILTGEHIWCQGYSEPNAGSDLASLRTTAIAQGSQFVVNGQKIWTTLAQDATHIFLLVRTDNTVKKQAGISFLLVDIKSPGITVRPIRNIAGEEEFCEVFFDDVLVPQENLVGELNQGWTIAKALLGFERLFVGSPQQSRHALGQLAALARTRGLFSDEVFRTVFGTLALDVEDLDSMYSHFADFVKRGESLPDSVSLLKIWATETYARISFQLAQWAGMDGGSRELVSVGGADQIDPLAALLNATITTIYGGTNEIQRNIFAKQVLRLPS